MIKKSILISLFFLMITSCESDDICPESSQKTPRVIITFYDISNPELRKDVENLAIYRLLNGEMEIFNEINGINTDSIAIPLRDDESISNFKFYKNFTPIDNTPNGIDNHIFIDYEINEIFISRACGFINNYNILSFYNYDPSDPSTNQVNWVLDYVILNNLVTDENESHIKILH